MCTVYRCLHPLDFSMNDIPGKNPGTSTNVTMGILNASQNLTKRAPFTDALMSKQPVTTSLM